MQDNQEYENGPKKSWKTVPEMYSAFIMRDLKQEYDFPTPTPEDLKNIRVRASSRFTRHWMATSVSNELIKYTGQRAREDGLENRTAPTGWTLETTQNHAHMAFNCAQAAVELGVENYNTVIQKYAEVVAQSENPDFSSKLGLFLDASFKTSYEREITGKEIYAKAVASMKAQGHSQLLKTSQSL